MITSVRLRNFKNFADERLRLGPFTVIVGANASGKSNIRDAFRFLHGIGRGYGLADILGGRYGAGGQVEWEPIRGATREIVRLGQSEFMLDVEFNSRGLSTDMPPLRFDSMSYHIRVCRSEVPGGEFSLVDAGAYANSKEIWSAGDSELRKSIPFPRSHTRAEGGFKKFMLLGRVQEALKMRFFDPMPDSMRQPSFPGQTVLGDQGENLSAVLRNICAEKSRKETLIEWIRELTPMDVIDLNFPDDPSGRIHLTICELGGRKVSAYSASDGTLRFLAMLAALLSEDAAGLYFFEEIDNGVHPSRLHLLLDLIEQQTAEGKVQVVATTHSPELLSMMSDCTFEDSSVVCRLPDNADSIVRPVSEIPRAAELRKSQGLGRLLAGGWMENVLAFSEDGGEDSG